MVTSHPIQYQAPWFRALAQVVDLDVYFCHRQDAAGQAAAGFDTPFEWDVPLVDGYRHHWLDNHAARPDVSRYRGCDTPGIDTVLAEGGFDACIVNGWYLKSYVQAIRACRKHRVKVLVRGDSHLGTPRSFLKSAVKWLPYRLLLNRVDAHLCVGKANESYLRHYGVPAKKLFLVPHFVDNEFFARLAGRARGDGSGQRIRERFAIPPGAIVALFVGRLVAQKRVEDLIAALAALGQRSGASIHGLIVGSGPRMGDLQALARRLDVPAHFAGFCNQTQLPAFYAAADVLVLPSDGRETWGLVVNEAMACGRPAIVSDAVGCRADLVEEGATGWSFPLGDTDRLAGALRRASVELRARPDELRQSVLARIDRYTCSIAVDATMKALTAIHAVEGADRRAGAARQGQTN